jgi:hypothetical protein
MATVEPGKVLGGFFPGFRGNAQEEPEWLKITNKKRRHSIKFISGREGKVSCVSV